MKRLKRLFMRKLLLQPFFGGTFLAVIFLCSPVFSDATKLRIAAYDTPASEAAALLSKELAGGAVLFLGEVHTSYAGHLKQAEILQELVRLLPGSSFALGLEMFPASAQGALDDYIKGKIDELEFLKLSRYFQEWGYDYHLYKPLIDFARKNKIRLVGLNLETALSRRIGREGFGGLSSQELASLPQTMDFNGGRYRQKLKRSYDEHVATVFGRRSLSTYSFQNFFLAQVVRDEYMARSAAIFLEKNPKTPLVIIAGNGHIEFHDGIVSRLKRLSGRKMFSVLFDQPYDPRAAGYFVYTKEVEFTGAPRLFVILDLTKKRPVIAKIDSRAAKSDPPHPLQKNDEIVSIDSMAVSTLAEIKLALYRKKYGERVVIEVVREGKKETLEYLLRDYTSKEFSGKEH